MPMDPLPSQQHAGLQHVLQLQQELTRPEARFKPFSVVLSAAYLLVMLLDLLNAVLSVLKTRQGKL